MSREKVKNHEYSFDIGSNPTETVIEMCVCVCIERLTIKFSERAKPLLCYEFYRVFSFSKRKYEYFVSNKAQKNVYLADVGFLWGINDHINNKSSKKLESIRSIQKVGKPIKRNLWKEVWKWPIQSFSWIGKYCVLPLCFISNNCLWNLTYILYDTK